MSILKEKKKKETIAGKNINSDFLKAGLTVIHGGALCACIAVKNSRNMQNINVNKLL